MEEFLLHSHSSNTNSKYFYSFKRWEQFISKEGGKSIPASPIHVALYLTHLLDKGSSKSVVQSAVYGIKWAHNIQGIQDPTTNSFVVNLMEAAKRQPHRPRVKKDHITVDVLINLCSKYKDCNDLLVIRDLTMIILCFAGFLRYDEVSGIRCKDIVFKEDHFSINIFKSKTDQYRLGDEIVICKGESIACPYLLLKKYFQLAMINSESENFLFRPIFRSKQVCSLIYKNKRLSYTRARECIVSRLKSICPDLNIGLHSLRAGGATAAANSDVNERCWKRHGRWKSDTAKDGYVADSLDHRLQVTKKLGL
ncbi:uncharacterized protein LOC134706597 isoform X1 [Mytilus trossulus]|uniref:uncharacterized protein LOC134706597 isoform X1 n=1 Tax=Mytilus trossulus TaxID=6551 RepID=UPI003004D409